MSAQQRLISAFAQSDQRLLCPHEESLGPKLPIERTAKTDQTGPSTMAIFHIKNSDIFHISAQNIDCGYSLEPPYRGGSYPQSMFFEQK